MRILVLAPHTDDGEIGCGGTISRLIEEGNDVVYVAFSVCEESVPAGFPRDILAQEVVAATSVLGLAEPFVKRYSVRTFPQHRQKILEDMIALETLIRPQLVFTPSLKDVHQDHAVVALESIRAFRKQSVLGYESIWNNFSFSPSCFYVLEKKHVVAKEASLKEYKSQQYRRLSETTVRSLAICRGAQIRQNYAEAFEVIRWIM